MPYLEVLDPISGSLVERRTLVQGDGPAVVMEPISKGYPVRVVRDDGRPVSSCRERPRWHCDGVPPLR